jgi:transcription-repair coupling factor (superfamily II helicase)
LPSSLCALGYNRTSTVFDHSEFAARGSIIDVFDNYNNCGVRLDFFGNILESIKLFDLTTQKTFANIKEVTIFQASEVILNEKSKEIFLEKYKKINPHYLSCPLYIAVKEGNYFAGWENWLALFYQNLISVFDYFGTFSIFTPNNLNIKINNLYRNIESIYEERIRQNEKYKEEYFPLKPNELWLEEDLLNLTIQNSSNIVFYDNNSRFNDGDIKNITDDFNIISKRFADYKKVFFFGYSCLSCAILLSRIASIKWSSSFSSSLKSSSSLSSIDL